VLYVVYVCRKLKWRLPTFIYAILDVTVIKRRHKVVGFRFDWWWVLSVLGVVEAAVAGPCAVGGWV
jgi:hypothetical protein